MKRRNFIAMSVFSSLVIADMSEAFSQASDKKPKAITNKINKKPLQPIYIPPDGPGFAGSAKIRFSQTNNQVSFWEHVVPPKKMGPPPHVHKNLDEIMRVLEGTASVLIGNKVFEVPAGGWLIRPHGIKHTYWNAGDTTLKFIDVYPNQNFEVYLEEFVKLMQGFAEKNIPRFSPAAIKQLDVLQTEWGITVYYDQMKPLMDKYGVS